MTYHKKSFHGLSNAVNFKTNEEITENCLNQHPTLVDLLAYNKFCPRSNNKDSVQVGYKSLFFRKKIVKCAKLGSQKLSHKNVCPKIMHYGNLNRKNKNLLQA